MTNPSTPSKGLTEERKDWVAADYAAYYERQKKGTQRPFHFNLLVETIAVALFDKEAALRAERTRAERAEADLADYQKMLRRAVEFVALVYRRGGDAGMENSGGLLDEIHALESRRLGGRW